MNSAKDKAMTRVVVGMSGGVDSSVAAYLLLQQGYRVEGLFMQNWQEEDDQCTAIQDYRDAAGVCQTLGIRLHSVNFSNQYWVQVFDHFLHEYQAGRTPNPDIMCNKEIKFKAFLDYARNLGADFIATGHYARRDDEAEKTHMLRGLDKNKDQSYFLYTLGQQQLRHTLFPLGELKKDQVREIAQRCGFHNHAKKDSTGICFIGERKFNDFLSNYLPAQPGDIVDEKGQVIGRHRGLMFHTLGQRQGLGIGGLKGGAGTPWYVIDKCTDRNQLVVGQGHDHPRLFKQTLSAQQLHWCDGRPPQQAFGCSAKVRYRQTDAPCHVYIDDQENGARVDFDVPIRAITAGQSVVFYQREKCLGGGIIQ